MTSERWYPTVITLGDGSNMIVGGSTIALENFAQPQTLNNPTYEYYPPKKGKFPRQLDLLQWAYPFNLYPQTFLLPSGNVFVMASNRSVLIHPDDTVTSLPDHPNIDHRPWIYPWTPTMFVKPMTIANNFAFTLMICGGTLLDENQTASVMCLEINPDDSNPKWIVSPDTLSIPRLMPDSVILPDGKILFVNGLRQGQAGGGRGVLGYFASHIIIFGQGNQSFLLTHSRLKLLHCLLQGQSFLQLGHFFFSLKS